MITKRKHVSNFMQLSNLSIQKDLKSSDAVAVLCYLMSQPSNFVIHKTTLYDRWGRRTTDNGFKELASKNYIVGFSCRIKKNGRFVVEYFYNVSDFPFSFDEYNKWIKDSFEDIFAKTGEFPSCVRVIDHSPLTIDEKLLSLCPDFSPSNNLKKAKNFASCTKRTTKNIKKNINKKDISIVPAEPERDDDNTLLYEQVKKQIDYNELLSRNPECATLLNKITTVITSVYGGRKHTYHINQCFISVKNVVQKLKQLGSREIEYVLSCVSQRFDSIKTSAFNYILTALYNASFNLAFGRNKNRILGCQSCFVNDFEQTNMDTQLDEMEQLLLYEVNCS